ncbi:MAG: DNA gyrase inhibitor YacG [Betaproteobacteria bacterium]|nr:DNA gyrase inhibitor YacG [Betaproteobacteria bacterium]
MAAAPARSVACPRCGAPSIYAPENRWRPFCSERCRVIDLGNWAAEAYRVPAAPERAAEPPAEAAPDPH